MYLAELTGVGARLLRSVGRVLYAYGVACVLPGGQALGGFLLWTARSHPVYDVVLIYGVRATVTTVLAKSAKLVAQCYSSSWMHRRRQWRAARALRSVHRP